MTWLSRLLPQSPSLSRLAKPNNRTRQAQRRRRQATLETLEGRTLLSNVSVSVVGHELVILGDTHNDSFSVTDNVSTGLITVVGTASSTKPHAPASNTTQINGQPVPSGFTSTTAQAITSLFIYLPGDYNSTDNVTITGTGTGSETLTAGITIIAPGVTGGNQGLDLNLTVTNITGAGPFALYDAPTTTATFPVTGNTPSPALPHGEQPNAPPGYVFPTVGSLLPVTAPTKAYSNNLGGVLNASITHSTFSSLYIEQDGCCPASVVLDHDSISGYLTVEEGVANGDFIQLTNSTAGATTLIQGYGPTMTGNTYQWTGAGDVITVQDDGTPNPSPMKAGTGILDLCITQLGTGGSGSLAGPFGVPAAINGGGQQILVGTVSPVEVGVAGFGIKAVQDDSPVVTIPPLVPIGSAVPVILPNLIHIESITVYGHLTNSIGPNGPPSIYTCQGDGQDSTIIDSSTVWGNISAYQGNGAGDSVLLAADVAGWTTPPPALPVQPWPTGMGQPVYLSPYFGCVTVHQGTAAVADQPTIPTGGDTVTLNSAGSEYQAFNSFNNLVITQCDLSTNFNPNSILVDSTVVVTGNILIFQGDAGFQNGGTLNGTDTGDLVTISATTAGYVTVNGPVLCDHGGLVAIKQGNGYEDGVIFTPVGTEGVLPNVFNNVLIWQGESLVPPDCLQPTGDFVTIDGTTIWSDLLIFQNAKFAGETGAMTATTVAATDASMLSGTTYPTSDDTGGGLGNNIVSIAATPGLGEAGQVYVGEETLIYQGGKNNSDYLGGGGSGAVGTPTGPDFETGNLDIFTGFGGGGYVTAANTTVVFGSFFGFPFVISGFGLGNTYVDGGGNSPDPLPTGGTYPI